MAPRVQQDVRQRVAHLARRAQNVKMEAIREHRTAPREDAIHGSRETGGDRFHPASEIARARRFDERVQMIVLNRVVNEPKSPALACLCEAAFELANEPPRAKRGEAPSNLQRHVTGKTRRERSAHAVRMARARAALAASARASSTPARGSAQIEIELPRAPRHARHSDMQV